MQRNLILLAVLLPIAFAFPAPPTTPLGHSLCYLPPESDSFLSRQQTVHSDQSPIATLSESFMCQMCLKEVRLAKKYQVCGGRIIQYHIQREVCDTYLPGSIMDRECRAIAIVIYHDIIQWGDNDPEKLCAILIRNPCS